MRVLDLMHEDVLTCRRITTVRQAVVRMAAERASMAVVVDEVQQYRGLVRAADLAALLVEHPDSRDRDIPEDAYAKDVESIDMERTLHDALATMKAQRMEALPVVDHHGAFRGLLGVHDIAAHVLQAEAAPTPEEVVDVVATVGEDPPGLSGARPTKPATESGSPSP